MIFDPRTEKLERLKIQRFSLKKHPSRTEKAKEREREKRERDLVPAVAERMAIAKTDLSRFNVTFARDMILSLNWRPFCGALKVFFLFVKCLLSHTHKLRAIGQPRSLSKQYMYNFLKNQALTNGPQPMRQQAVIYCRITIYKREKILFVASTKQSRDLISAVSCSWSIVLGYSVAVVVVVDVVCSVMRLFFARRVEKDVCDILFPRSRVPGR